ncbi:hypothetical protein IFM89_006310 [Coptis chinensis]|uniref:DNA/RNA-binding protein Alba-like domain-containing protein n=1 Tax=Coptis chinensis TaxID=261450 RepID=A0A835M414_9MAGN|nr:hypothetical protein IFM89_006310 [Coptis chinensis]
MEGVAVEGITEGVENMTVNDTLKKNRIQVSNTKNSIFHYVNLAKKIMKQHNEVELSALGMAIASVVSISEILKSNGFAVEKKIFTSTVEMNDAIRKAKIAIVLGKSDKFDELMGAAEV